MPRLRHALQQFTGELKAIPGNPAFGQATVAYFDGLASMAADCDAMVIALDTTAATAALDFALKPRPGTRLAAFAALQKPTDQAMIDRLPASAPPIALIGGHLELGPYRDGVIAAMAMLYNTKAPKDLIAALESVRQALTGDLAIAANFSPTAGLAITELLGVSDPGAADKALGRALDGFKTGQTITAAGTATTITANPGTTTYDGVTLRSYDTVSDSSSVAPAQRKIIESFAPTGTQRTQLATFDKLSAFVMSKDSLADASRAIDAARGKAPRLALTDAGRALFAASRSRADSLAIQVDIGAVLDVLSHAGAGAAPLMVSLGFRDRNAHVRVAVPAPTAQVLMKIANP
jgi:hypothetical protein